MTTRKVQLYISDDSDSKLYKFLDEIEAEAPDTKGYLGSKLKEILRAWSGLVDMYGERDVLLLSMRLAAGHPPKTTVGTASTAGEVGTSGVSEVGTSAKNEVGTSALKGFGSSIGKNRYQRG